MKSLKLKYVESVGKDETLLGISLGLADVFIRQRNSYSGFKTEFYTGFNIFWYGFDSDDCKNMRQAR